MRCGSGEGEGGGGGRDGSGSVVVGNIEGAFFKAKVL